MNRGIWAPRAGLTIAREPAGSPGGATVLQVASDPKVHAQGHNPLPHSRPAQQADPAPSPFESLVDDPRHRARTRLPAPTARNRHDHQAAATASRRRATTTRSRPSLRMRRALMRSRQRRMWPGAKPARMRKLFAARRTATARSPPKTRNQPITRKPIA